MFGKYFDQRITDSVNELINYGGDCRTAPATPGLLKSMTNIMCKLDIKVATLHGKTLALNPYLA